MLNGLGQRVEMQIATSGLVRHAVVVLEGRLVEGRLVEGRLVNEDRGEPGTGGLGRAGVQSRPLCQT